MDLNLILIPLFIVLGLVVVFTFIWSAIDNFFNRGRVARSLNLSLFAITLPQEAKKDSSQQKPAKELISVMEPLYASLSTIKEKGWWKSFFYGQPYLTLELAVPHVGEEICFYVAAPKRYEDILEKSIHSFFPQAAVERVKDYNIFNPEGAAAASFLKLARDSVLPIKTYQKLETDPLSAVTTSLSKLEERGEGAAIQITIRPNSKKWAKYGYKIAKKMREGKTFETAQREAGRSAIEKGVLEVGEAIMAKPKEETAPKEQKTQAFQDEFLKAIEGKISKTTFETSIRLIASAATEEKAEHVLSELENSFNQFMEPVFNSFRPIRVRGARLKKLIFNFAFRIFNPHESSVLNIEELTSIYHFPMASLETPKVKFLRSRQASAPVSLPSEGWIIGKNTYRGTETIVRMGREDRRRHLYMIGQTGTGKSSFLQEMIKQDIEAGEGVAVLDPHGTLIETVLGLIPKERAEDVIIFDPNNLERVAGLNMLQYDPSEPEQKSFIVDEMILIFNKLYDMSTSGPMFEQYARNALLLLMDDPGEAATLVEVPRVLSDADYRRYLLDKCKNILVKDFWEKEAEKAGGEAALANMVPYITSKFNVFIANDFMRPIIGQAKSSFNFREIMDNKKIFLANLSGAKVGDINRNLLGLIIVGKLWMAARSHPLGQGEINDLFLYIDEFQNFVTETISTILAEARKFRLNLIMAHQFIKQLPEKISSAVFGNAGSKICFRIGVEDAPIMVKEFEPVFTDYDLINIDNFNAYVKMLVNGKTTQPFNVEFTGWSKEDRERAKLIKELALLKYTKDRSLVEEEIVARRIY